MRTRNRLLLFLLVLVGALGEVCRTTSFDDLDLRGHPWRDPDDLSRIAYRTRDVVVELLIRAQGRSPVAYLVLGIFVAASFVLRARAHHVATAVPLPWRAAQRRARMVWGGALLVAAIPQVPVVPAFALCAVAIELGFRLRFRDLLGDLRRGRAPGFELEPASGDASPSVPTQRAWGRGGAEVLVHRRDVSAASYRTAHAQELLRVEYRRPALLRGCALLAVLGAAWLLVVAGPAEATSVEPLPSSRGRSVVAATAQPAEVPSTRSPQDPRRESFSLGECLDEGALRDVPEVSPAPETARDGAFYVRWIARAEPGPPAPEDDDPQPKRKLHPIWDTDPTWGAYVSVGNQVVELATRVPQMPELLRTGDPTVLAAFGLPPVGPAWTPSWRFVAVGSQVFLVELEAKGGQERFDNFGCVRFPPLRIIVRFARPLHAPWADSRCVVQANDPAESCGTL